MQKEKRLASYGVVSMITVLAAAIYTCFAVMTYLSAANELELAKRAAEKQSEYYAAEGKLNEKLNEILQSVKQGSGTEAERLYGAETVSLSEEGGIISVSVQIDENRTLNGKACFDADGRLVSLEKRTE